jgi:hypothetical protein
MSSSRKPKRNCTGIASVLDGESSCASGFCCVLFPREIDGEVMETRKRERHGEISCAGGRRVSSPEYRSWQFMKDRCRNPNSERFSDYGGRGIDYEPRWDLFSNFLADMGRKPSDCHSLDRIDVNGGYCKANCKWSTDDEQNQNRRSTKLTFEDARRIREMYAMGGWSHSRLGEVFGVGESIVWKILHNKSWREPTSNKSVAC